jgi:hypothetical protein
MNWPPDIADELPAPRDDEPPELRRDIADELADHLACALNREIHRTGDETRARENVLDRFGDPVQIARRLWFDALKEKIMSQRIVVVAAVLLALAGFASTGLTWVIIRQTRTLNEQLLAESRNAAEQSRAANAALLDKLAELADRPPAEAAAPKSMEWNPVKIRLVSGETGGPPAVGYSVRMQGYLLDTAKEIRVDRTTGEDGIADFGLVRPGQHHFVVTAPWGESLGVLPLTDAAQAQRRGSSSYRETGTYNRLTVLPGEAIVHEVVCPVESRAPADISMTVDWPDDLREKNLWSICSLQLRPRDIGGHDWNSSSENEYQLVLIGPNQELHYVTDPKSDYFQGKSSQTRRSLVQNLFDFRGVSQFGSSGPFGNVSIPGLIQKRVTINDPASQRPVRVTSNLVLALPPSESSARLMLPAGDYRLKHLGILEAPTEAEDDRLPEYPVVIGFRYDVPGRIGDESDGAYIALKSARMVSRGGPPGLQTEEQLPLSGRDIPLFSAHANQTNAWKLTLPDVLSEKVREALAVPDQPESNTSF